MIKKLFISFIFIIVSMSIYADVTIYLNTRIQYKKQITLRSLGIIEGSSVSSNMLDTEVPSSVLKDGYIDQNEIQQLVKKITGIMPVVYGTAVKIELIQKNAPEEHYEVIVKRNDSLVLTMRKGRIRIELSGKALSDSTKNQIINVRIKNSKRLKAKITSSGRGIIVQ